MGLADSKWNGVTGSVSVCVGLDIHSTPGLTKVRQKLAKETGGVPPDEFCKIALNASNGYSFWFSSESGKIWARSSDGTWTLAHTTISTGADICLGAAEYDGYIYWATHTRLHRIAIANADDSWASVSHDWATFGVTNASFHPMAIQDLTLFIADGNQIAQVDENGTFSSNVLDIKTPLVIKTMVPYEWDLLIGTWVANTINRAEIIRWDTVSPSWNTSDPIEEVGINAFIRDDNYVYVNAGRAGNMYFYNGEQLLPFKRVPGDYTNAKYGYVHPNSVGNFMGQPIFGFSNGTGNSTLQGVYTLGSYSRDYPKVLDLSWVNSQDKVTNQEIGAILVIDFDLFVAWDDASTTKGVDKMNWSAKYASAYFETMKLFQEDRDKQKTLAAVSVLYDSLPASTGVTISYSVNSGAYVALTDVDNTILQSLVAEAGKEGIGSLQIKVAFDVSGNTAPTMEALDVVME